MGQGDQGGWTPPTNQLRETKYFAADDDNERRRQGADFMAGTVFAAGAAVSFPVAGPAGVAPGLPSLFTVLVHDGPETWGPAPGLRALFELRDQLGAVALHESSTVGTSWAVLDDKEEPLVKLKVDVHEPVAAKGRFELLLLARNFADTWQHIAGGGLLGITTMERLQTASSGTFADGVECCVLLGMGASPGLQMLMANHDWPGGL